MRYRLRTLLICLAFLPPAIAMGWWIWQGIRLAIWDLMGGELPPN